MKFKVNTRTLVDKSNVRLSDNFWCVVILVQERDLQDGSASVVGLVFCLQIGRVKTAALSVQKVTVFNCDSSSAWVDVEELQPEKKKEKSDNISQSEVQRIQQKKTYLCYVMSVHLRNDRRIVLEAYLSCMLIQKFEFDNI